MSAAVSIHGPRGVYPTPDFDSKLRTSMTVRSGLERSLTAVTPRTNRSAVAAVSSVQSRPITTAISPSATLCPASRRSRTVRPDGTIVRGLFNQAWTGAG